MIKSFVTFKHYLKESIIDIPKNSLDPTVFSFSDNSKPILQSSIRMQIKKDIERISAMYPVENYFIIGSILTRRYTPSSDIDVCVELENRPEKNRINTDELLGIVKSINGKLAVGTTHPINYKLLQYKYDLAKTDAAYDIENERWLKTDNTDDLDLQNYSESFQEAISKVDLMTGELRRDIIDLNLYKSMPVEKVKKLKALIENKLREIEGDINNLSNTSSRMSYLRRLAFEKDLSQEELAKYSSNNWLPENIIYKLYGKYYYKHFIDKLKDFLEEKEKLNIKDIPYIQELGSQLWQR